MLIGWNGETLPALPLEEEITIAAEAGYDGLELFIPKLAPFLARHTTTELARRLQESGLRPLTLNGIENINLRTAEAFAEVKAECRRLADLAQQIGCPCIVVVPSPRPAGMSWPEVRGQTVRALQELADVSAPQGVQLAFEFLAPANCSVRTLDQAWEIIQATGRQEVGLVLDTYHFIVGGSRWESLDEIDIDRLLIVHINDVEDRPWETLTDADRLLPGEGILPLTQLLSRLQALGYDWAYSLEVMRPAYRERDPREYARAGHEAITAVLKRVSLA